MGLWLEDGKLLLEDGKLAMSENCCCGCGCCSGTPPSVTADIAGIEGECCEDGNGEYDLGVGFCDSDTDETEWPPITVDDTYVEFVVHGDCTWELSVSTYCPGIGDTLVVIFAGSDFDCSPEAVNVATDVTHNDCEGTPTCALTNAS